MFDKKQVSNSKYAKMVEDVRAIYKNAGARLFHEADDYGINQYYPSDNDKVVFEFYWTGLSAIKTPEGQITPLGGYSYNGASHTDERAMEAMTERFGLQLLGQRDGLRGERWFMYEATKE